jgi:hypothetical protein
MRLFRGLIAAFVGLNVAVPAAAQVPDVLFRGTTRPILEHGTGAWCAVELGPTSFQRGTPQRVLISFPAVHYTLTGAPATYYTLSGNARMIFATSTTGALKFDQPKNYPVDILEPDFSQYNETYNATKGSLQVRFRLRFANCHLVVNNTYWD